MQPEIYGEVEKSISKLRQLSPEGFVPRVVVTLGTGLGHLEKHIDKVADISYRELDGFALSALSGHAGCLYLGYWNQMPIAILSGRRHLYEGYNALQVTFPIRVLAQWGAGFFIFTNAAGGLAPNMVSGHVMLITDHINLTGHNPLVGPNVDGWGERFLDMSNAYDGGLLNLGREAAKRARLTYYHGVYAGLAGPSLETPAETRMLQIMGASAVGMSTVLEVIVARHHGARVMGLSAITNINDPDNMQSVSLEQVLDGAQRASQDMGIILTGVLANLAGN